MLTDGLEWCGLLLCIYQLFGLSFWRHPFTAEEHWWGSDAMLHVSKSDKTNSSTSWMTWEWVHFKSVILGWTIPLIGVLYGLLLTSVCSLRSSSPDVRSECWVFENIACYLCPVGCLWSVKPNPSLIWLIRIEPSVSVSCAITTEIKFTQKNRWSDQIWRNAQVLFFHGQETERNSSWKN